MGKSGFSLVELLTVIVIAGTLLAIGSLQFKLHSEKAGIESQMRTMYSDIMEARSQALMEKKDRSIYISATQFKVFPTSDGTGTPIKEATLKHPVTYDFTDTVAINTRGLADVPKVVCVTPAGNPAAMDSIRITETMIQLGKWDGGTCDSDHFTPK